MMRSRPGFTIVELLIVAVVIAILAAIIVVSYNGIRVAAMTRAAQVDLRNTAVAMEVARQQTGAYPTELPASATTGGGSTDNTNTGGSAGASSSTSPSGGNGRTITLEWSGTKATYQNLNEVQNGVLFSNICQDLIDEGLGRGVNQGGATQNYITSCGNWNRNGMQVTGWSSRSWSTPLTDTQFLQYADNFTSNDTWNASQVDVVKNFYRQMVERHTAQGGRFPIQSFWDAWATPQNGGVIKQELPEEMTVRTGYCVEATVETPDAPVWHIDETNVLTEGPCED